MDGALVLKSYGSGFKSWLAGHLGNDGALQREAQDVNVQGKCTLEGSVEGRRVDTRHVKFF